MNDTNPHTIKLSRPPFGFKVGAEDLVNRPDMNAAPYSAFVNRPQTDRPSRELILSSVIHAR
jgi:hypothetical protein